MRKKFTLLITVTALLLGSGGGQVWGQQASGSIVQQENPELRAYGDTLGGTQNASGLSCQTNINVKSSFTVENNYGPGETGTLSPKNAFGSKNTGYWGAISQAFNMGNGRITVGGTTNHVIHKVVGGNHNSNLAGIGTSVTVTASVNLKTASSCGSGDLTRYGESNATGTWVTATSADAIHSKNETWGPATVSVIDPIVPDGTGLAQVTPTYSSTTKIDVGGGSNTTSANPWWLQQFYFMDNPWYYYTTSFGYSVCSHTVSFDYKAYSYSCTGSSPSSPSWTYAPALASNSGSHNQVSWATTQNNAGGYVPGTIELIAGSHVRLEGGDAAAKSVAAGTHTSTKTTLILPTQHYSLMNDKDFDAASIATTSTLGQIDNLTTLGHNAVMGIQGNFQPSSVAGSGDYIKTNPSGGTILIGASTTGQQRMVLSTTTGTPTVTKQFERSGNVYTNSFYLFVAANFGNYGANDVTITDAATMFGNNVGTAGWQVYAHNGTGASCLNFTYNTSPLTIAVNTFGSYLQSVENSLTYNVSSTLNASNTSGTAGGHTTLRAGNEVRFNSFHTYAGTGIGDYWVHAVGAGAYSGYTFCGTGNIIVATGIAPVYAHNNANISGGHLKWEANNNIQTGSQVKFENDYSTNIDWIAGNDILTNDTVTFINGSSIATGHTKWTAGHDIVTNSDVAALTPSNGVIFTHNGSGLTQWQAGNDIHTQNIINFERMTSSSGKTRWWAGRNIFTDKDVTFISRGATNDSIYWRANTGDIQTGHHSGGGRIDFQNLDASATGSHTKWHAYNNIETHAHVNFYNNTASSNTMWQTDVQDIRTNDLVTFVNEQAGNTDWEAYRHILTYDTVEFTNNGAGYTKWDAETGNISTNRPTTTTHPWTTENGFITFNNTNTGVTEWEAGQHIYTNNVVAFNNATLADGYIKWWAQGGNIELNDSMIFNQLPTAAAVYATLRGTNHIVGIDNSTKAPAASLWLIANDSILSERKGAPLNSPSGNNEEPLLINFNADNDAPIMLHAVTGDVTLDGVLHIDRQNIGQSETTIEAGRDIHFLDTVTLFDPSNADILLHAHRDILMNMEGCSSDKTAPVTFEVTSNALTRWIADRNIHTRDTMNFKYGSTGNTVRDLHLVAQGGNIKTERWFNIDYDSDNQILFSAVDDIHPYGYAVQAFNSPTVGRVNNFPLLSGTRYTNNGNIWFNDSMKITRTNASAGITAILAKYNIRTAMFDYLDSLSTGNNTTVESYMGDIFLGYSTDPDMCANPSPSSSVSGGFFDYDTTRFKYTVLNPLHQGLLDIKAGFEDMSNTGQMGGGNIYFTHVDKYAVKAATSETKITIPFSNEYFCDSGWSPDKLNMLGDPACATSRMHYEHAGIIGGVGPCGLDPNFGSYAPMQGPSSNAARDTSLIYFGNHGNLLVDAGTRGNIIINRGTYLNFQEDNGNTEFRTRDGNIDMRYPFNADSLQGSLLFLASSDLPGKLNVTNCECGEEKNNVYLQDFQYNPIVNSGSVFVGADNNIKLQYGGLKSIGTTRDPFFSPNGDNGYPCGDRHHCDADTAENQARDLILNFYQDGTGANIAKGGFAAVASDRIDTYKNMSYNGGSGNGLSSVPTYGSLHGESVAGYGLYIKTQGNKRNWNMTDHDVNNTPNPWLGAACIDDPCSNDFLHNIARVTFHADARIYAENQRVLISSPVLETFGNADYNTDLRKGTKTSILLHADSLIYHDSLIIDGPKTQFTTWSGLYRDMPVIKLGHHRFTPPAAEDGGYCAPCYTHPKDPRSTGTKALDTVFVTFRNDASVKRLHTLVAEHAVVSFLTDSFDHHRGNPTLNAKFYTDTFKIRNHVELFKTPDHTHDGHFELISEEQMSSKDYAGIYARHLHMEPISPSCSDFNFSQLWVQDPMLDVITSSTFGGFGWIHADVHVEIEGNLFPGFASLGTDGNCYEQRAGVLKMKDLRLDKGASVKVTIGDQDAQNSFAENYDCPSTFETLELGRYADCLIVDSLTIYGSLEIDLAVRSGLSLAAGESRCFPILQYKSVQEGVLNNIKLKKTKLTSKDHKSIEGTYYLTIDVDTACNVVYVCVATVPNPVLMRDVFIPAKSGITTFPVPGTYHVRSGASFGFNVTYGAEYIREGEQLAVYTGRVFGGQKENIVGVKNANGEYEYVINDIRTNIVLEFGPDYVASDDIEGALVWSHNNMIHIRVDKKDIASIYMITGQMVKQIELSEGTSSVPMEYGVYIVTLKDGSVHKVIVK